MSCLKNTRKRIDKDFPMLDKALDGLRKKGLVLAFHAAFQLIQAQADILEIELVPDFEKEFFALGDKFHLFVPPPVVELPVVAPPAPLSDAKNSA